MRNLIKVSKKVKVLCGDKFRTIKMNISPRYTAELNAVLQAFKAPLCFVKMEGGWYKVVKNSEGKTETLYVARALYLLSNQEWVDIALNRNFTANVK